MRTRHNASDQAEPERFRASNPGTQEEVGGILERAFAREGGREPLEEEARFFLDQIQAAEGRAEAAESLSREAELAAERAGERYARSGRPEDLEAMRRWEEKADAHRREGESMRGEADRLRGYLP